MGAKQRLLAGLVIMLVIGLGGGFGVRTLAAGMPVAEASTNDRVFVDRSLRVSLLRGSAKLLASHGEWRPALKDDVVSRPTGFDVSGGDTQLTLVSPDLNLSASHGARGVLNAGGQPLRIYVDRGRVWVQSPKESVEIRVDRFALELSGRSYGVWIQDNRVLVSAIGRDLVIRRGGQENSYPPGTEVVATHDSLRTRQIPSELSVEIDGAHREGSKWTVEGHTSPTATVLVVDQGTATEVPLSADGKFSAALAQQVPGKRELVVFDSAGREAQVGQPSSTLEKVADKKGRRAKDEPDDKVEPEPEPASSPNPAPHVALEASKPSPKADKPEKGEKKGGKKGGKKHDTASEEPDDGDSIQLGDFSKPDVTEQAPKGGATPPTKVDLPKTEPPPSVAPASRPPEKPAPKAKEDDDVKLDWD
ncbi:MAG: hypothetical protein U1E65_31335 [Myxococcota bacterium]